MQLTHHYFNKPYWPSHFQHYVCWTYNKTRTIISTCKFSLEPQPLRQTMPGSMFPWRPRGRKIGHKRVPVITSWWLLRGAVPLLPLHIIHHICFVMPHLSLLRKIIQLNKSHYPTALRNAARKHASRSMGNKFQLDAGWRRGAGGTYLTVPGVRGFCSPAPEGWFVSIKTQGVRVCVRTVRLGSCRASCQDLSTDQRSIIWCSTINYVFVFKGVFV